MTFREQVHQALDTLTEHELVAVAHVVAVLRAGPRSALALEPDVYGPLYRQFASEDSALAEEGPTA